MGPGSLGFHPSNCFAPISPDWFCTCLVCTNNRMFCASSAPKPCKILAGNSANSLESTNLTMECFSPCRCKEMERAKCFLNEQTCERTEAVPFSRLLLFIQNTARWADAIQSLFYLGSEERVCCIFPFLLCP